MVLRNMIKQFLPNKSANKTYDKQKWKISIACTIDVTIKKVNNGSG